MSTTAVTIQARPQLPLADECCTPLLREPLSASQAASLAGILKALADPTRLRLVSMVAAHEGGEACVCDLTDPLGLTQPTISHHLKVLVDAGHLQPRQARQVGPTTRWCQPRSTPCPRC